MEYMLVANVFIQAKVSPLFSNRTNIIQYAIHPATMASAVIAMATIVSLRSLISLNTVVLES